MLKSKKKIIWNNGDVFVISLKDKTLTIGQILDLQMENIVRCSLYNERYNSIDEIKTKNVCQTKNLISLLSSSREMLDYNYWRIIGNVPIEINKSMYPNEEYKNKKWIGSISYDAELVEYFLNAFYGLSPWDDWYNPNYLDQFLIDKSKKPSNLILVGSGNASDTRICNLK